MRRRLLAAIGVTAIFAALPGAAAGAQVRSCVVDRIEGASARYWSAGVWAELATGLILAAETKISTGQDTRVRILCDNETVVIVGVATELNLENLPGADDLRKPVAIQLLDGIASLIMPRPFPSGFAARTAVAIASPRATEWLIEWHPGDGAAVFVRRGEVNVRSVTGGRFVLAAGDGITIAADGTAGEVKQWAPARIAQSTGRLGFDWQ